MKNIDTISNNSREKSVEYCLNLDNLSGQDNISKLLKVKSLKSKTGNSSSNIKVIVKEDISSNEKHKIKFNTFSPLNNDDKSKSSSQNKSDIISKLELKEEFKIEQSSIVEDKNKYDCDHNCLCIIF